MDIRILNRTVKSPIRFTTELDFPEEDLKALPWLAKDARYYSLDKKLDPGGFAIPYLGYPCDKNGKRCRGAPQVVIKIPNLEKGSRHTTDEVDKRRRYIEDKIQDEWHIVRKKLRKCKYANPIFDFGILMVGSLPIFVTAQLYLRDAVPLNKWLVLRHRRPEIVLDENNKEKDNWKGITKCLDWTSIAMMIAEGLVAIHDRRIVHGDIWPPNIFITDAKETYARFIDFGESFLMTPSDDPHTQINHEYRAPERKGTEYVTTEQVDVYSFGKLLFYMAGGLAEKIDSSRYGQRRRIWIREKLLERNPALAKENPSVVDIITHCTASDPVDRPTMREIYEELAENCAYNRTNIATSHHLKKKLRALTAAAKSAFADRGSVFLYFLHKKLAELEQQISNHEPEMIRLGGTRDEMIRSLVALFNELEHGDSWTSLTTPGVWQSSALGCDGRYATATIKAVQRGASVHRTYMVSIEELGLDWADRFARKLEEGQNVECRALAQQFRKAIREFQSRSEIAAYVLKPAFLNDHQIRFRRLVDSLRVMVETWDLGDRLFLGTPEGTRETKGLYIGLLPVATMFDAQKLRTKNPVSLMYIDREAEEHDKWLMVMTDLRGRNENEHGAVTKPELRGIRIYKSVQGLPHDRIIRLDRLMKDSFNIGTIIGNVASCAMAAAPVGDA
jgi:serine/threonine protein kinase